SAFSASRPRPATAMTEACSAGRAGRKPASSCAACRPAVAARQDRARRAPVPPRSSSGGTCSATPAGRALTLAIVIATHSSAGLAVVLVCALLPKVALLPIGGVVVDRLGSRRVAMGAAAASGAAQLSIGLLLLAGHIDFLLIAVAS